ASTAGRPTTATTTRETSGVTSGPAGPVGPLAPAEAAPAAGVIVEGGGELLLAEVGPERVDEGKLGVGELPQEEVRDPQLAGGTDQQVGVGHPGRIQVRRERLLVDLSAGGDGAVRGVDELGSPAVVEGDPQVQAAVALRLALERRHACPQL